MKNTTDAPCDASLTVSLGLPSRDSARGAVSAVQRFTKFYGTTREEGTDRKATRVGLNGRQTIEKKRKRFMFTNRNYLKSCVLLFVINFARNPTLLHIVNNDLGQRSVA
ncbi:uncharacterized protein LOC116844061 [Odontomachus brunneus]|uniref:uncharacterized protein LOC116844061 n=1 Tax=Odontomachus brunneus TaxID=486640 RepID=UPI0013F28D9C|nr:uncharacterized protein LOC116844061 [Odontomachus brunneus]